MWHHRFASNHRALAASLAASLISAAACGSEEPPAQKEAELIEDWRHPACAASGLLPPAPDTCAGPWSFGYRDLTRSAELCGTGQCVQHNSCTSWHRDTEGDWLGVVRSSRTDLGASTGFQCDANGKNCRGTAPTQIASFCATKASQYRSSLLSTALAGLPASVTGALQVTGRYVVSDHGADGETDMDHLAVPLRSGRIGIAIAPPALNGDTIEVLSDTGVGTWPVELDVGAGISPFTSFPFKLGGFQSGLPRRVFDHTRALLLVMEVERHVSLDPAWVPGVCQLAEPASP